MFKKEIICTKSLIRINSFYIFRIIKFETNSYSNLIHIHIIMFFKDNKITRIFDIRIKNFNTDFYLFNFNFERKNPREIS